MKEISTPTTTSSSVTVKEVKAEKPRRGTLEFLRQFARVYHATHLNGMPGIVMN